jgi:hypothetical protein
MRLTFSIITVPASFLILSSSLSFTTAQKTAVKTQAAAPKNVIVDTSTSITITANDNDTTSSDTILTDLVTNLTSVPICGLMCYTSLPELQEPTLANLRSLCKNQDAVLVTLRGCVSKTCTTQGDNARVGETLVSIILVQQSILSTFSWIIYFFYFLF